MDTVFKDVNGQVVDVGDEVLWASNGGLYRARVISKRLQESWDGKNDTCDLFIERIYTDNDKKNRPNWRQRYSTVRVGVNKGRCSRFFAKVEPLPPTQNVPDATGFTP